MLDLPICTLGSDSVRRIRLSGNVMLSGAVVERLTRTAQRDSDQQVSLVNLCSKVKHVQLDTNGRGEKMGIGAEASTYPSSQT